MREHIDIRQLLHWAYRDQAVETAPYPHPDAITVQLAVNALPSPYNQLVRHFALHKAAPAWRGPDEKVVSLDAVRRSRGLHVEWVRALAVLRSSLDGALGSFKPTGPETPERPWLTTTAPRTSGWSGGQVGG